MSSPKTGQQVEAVDHRAAAEAALHSIGGVRENGPLELAPIAQAHASLEIAEQLERLNGFLSVATHEARPIDHA
jgi:hypothetical protein